MLKLGIQSLWNRRFVALLTVLSIALSVALILGVERLRTEARQGFSNSASGIDLIVAPRGNPVQILLATVFGVGSTQSGLSWETFEWIEELPETAWAVPIAMGDNHQGYPVIGTSADYFDRYRHSAGQPLAFAAGEVFDDGGKAVIGAEVADQLGHGLGTEIVLAHGSGAVAFDLHEEAPFTVSGILARTGTAADRIVFVSLEGFDQLHEDTAPVATDPLEIRQNDGADTLREEQAEKDLHKQQHTIDDHGDHPEPDHNHAHEPEKINAIYVGLVNRAAVMTIQRALSEYQLEPVSAVMPNVALLELWSITGTAETALRLMASAVVLAGLVGLLVMLSATLESRRREFSILRSVGAQPRFVFGLIMLEAGLLTLSGILLGYGILTCGVLIADPILAAEFGLRLSRLVPSWSEAGLLAAVLAAGMAASVIPAWRVYKMTLADGITVRS